MDPGENPVPRTTNPTRAQLKGWLADIDGAMTFSPASSLVISCGTVTFDMVHGKVLLIWNKRFEIYQLPKGRKNIGETLLQAALRETFEETGVRVEPVQLKVATRATVPACDRVGEPHQKSPQVTEGHLSNEFFASCVYPDPQSDTNALKIIFYFAATADSTLEPETGTQEAWEKLRAEWVPIPEAVDKLRFQAESSVVIEAVLDVVKTGIKVGGLETYDLDVLASKKRRAKQIPTELTQTDEDGQPMPDSA